MQETDLPKNLSRSTLVQRARCRIMHAHAHIHTQTHTRTHTQTQTYSHTGALAENTLTPVLISPDHDDIVIVC